MKKILKNYKSTIILIGGIILGTIVGLIFKEKATILSPLGDIFINLMFVVIVPLVFLTISSSIIKMENPKRLGKIMIVIILVFLLMSLVAAFIGIGTTRAIKIIDSGFDSSTKSYFSMLGLSYYLEKEVFKNTIITISSVMSEGSTILFDYPNNDESETEILNQKLAEGAASEMKSKYSCGDIKRICEECGLLIYENIGYKEINQEYFNLYNSLNPNNKILASKGVSYCLLVKK